MSLRRKTILMYLISIASLNSVSASPENTIANQLDWIETLDNLCGGYYLDQPFTYPVSTKNSKLLKIASNQTLFSQSGTSILEGKVSLTRYGQAINANKAYLYRDPLTGKLSAVDLVGQIRLREPNNLVLGEKGRYDIQQDAKSFSHILYRTTMVNTQAIAPKLRENEITAKRKVTQVTAWGQADAFSQTEAGIFEFNQASYTTCPPIHPAWQVKAKHIELNKNSGRGYATHARIEVKGVPILYVPYIDFPIDNRRKSGLLWPTFSTKWGPTLSTPFYWNMAPNYDMTLTPSFSAKRGFQFSDTFRYLTPSSLGYATFSFLPKDRLFQDFQGSARATYQSSTDPITQGELDNLLNSSTTRHAFLWRDDTIFNDHWSFHSDYNTVSDDYYSRNFGSNSNELTQNQLLQLGELNYKSEHWNLTGRIQAYQTLHPINEPLVLNQYQRLPQFIFNADYPDQIGGVDFFIQNEVTHFNIQKMPGTTLDLPVGNRLHTQPGLGLPLSWPYFYIYPRIQTALTHYDLSHAEHSRKNRAIPIIDIASGSSLTRDTSWLSHAYQQTLEPQIYYTYIPYQDQSSIPNFDTTLNTLNYDQLFTYNRFSGLDRIGDANQISVGINSRFIDSQTGYQRIRLGLGEIFYFSNRRVTLCNDASCVDNPQNEDNKRRFSPLSGLVEYNVNPEWKVTANAIWSVPAKKLANTTLTLHYQTDNKHIFNASYSFARSTDVLSGVSTNPDDTLKLTDISFAWPITREISFIGQWSQDWNKEHFQNLIYGIEYDSCCWAVQLVAGREFTNLSADSTPQYNKEFYIQFALKGLGNYGSGKTSKTLSKISGYNTQLFGQAT